MKIFSIELKFYNMFWGRIKFESDTEKTESAKAKEDNPKIEMEAEEKNEH